MKTTARRIQKTRADRIFLGCNAIFLALILILVVYPVWYALAALLINLSASLVGRKLRKK